MSAKQLIPSATNIREVVGLAIGGGSTCWESIADAGTFQDQDAAEIMELAVARISQLVIETEQDPAVITDQRGRQDQAIQAAADALLSVCALQTGMDPSLTAIRARQAISLVMAQAEQEARHG